MSSSIKHIKNVCKIGKGSECCRYLMATENGFFCGKIDPDTKKLLDFRVDAGISLAVGDNCDGKDSKKLNDYIYDK